MRRLLLVALLFFPSAPLFAADVRFVQPLDGSQLFGKSLIAVETGITAIDRVEFRVDGVLIGVVRKAPWRIEHDFGAEAASRRIAATVVSDGFTKKQTTEIRTAAMSTAGSIDVDLVEVPVRVRGRGAIAAKDIRILENGRPQTIRSVERRRERAHFAFVLDRSLSMKGPKLSNALDAIEAAAKRLRADDTISIVAFNHVVDSPREVSRIRDLNASGGTSLRDAMIAASRDARSYLIVVTDGSDRHSRASGPAALQATTKASSMIYGIVLGSGNGSDFVEQAARKTGGITIEADAGSLQRAMHRILDDVDSRYVVSYQSNAKERGWRRIEVRSNSAALSGAREGYFAR
jgi:hypothetical protein